MKINIDVIVMLVVFVACLSSWVNAYASARRYRIVKEYMEKNKK